MEQQFKSIEEIDKTYHDHISSLELSGIPFNRTGLMAEWVQAVENFKEQQEQGPDYTRL